MNLFAVRGVVSIAALALAVGGCAPSPAPPSAGAPTGEGFLEGAGGVRLFYRVLGEGSDTVVVVHGGPGAGMETILPDLLPLAGSRVLVFYDQRGGGRSTLPADTALLDARYFVDDLEAVRRHFGLERMQIVAHSFGPILVARYLQAHPDRVERMVFLGSTHPRRADADQLARAAYQQADTAVLGRYIGLIQALGTDTLRDAIAACQEFEAMARAMAVARGEPANTKGTSCGMEPAALRYYFRHTARFAPTTFGDWDFTAAPIAAVEAPLLVVYGDADPMALAAQERWARGVPDTRVLVVPGAGKGAYADRPDVVFPAIEAFLDGAWPPAARVASPAP